MFRGGPYTGLIASAARPRHVAAAVPEAGLMSDEHLAGAEGVPVGAVGGWVHPPPAVPYQVADCHRLIVPHLFVGRRRPQIRCSNVPQTVRQDGPRTRQPPTLAKVPAEPPSRDDLRITFQVNKE